jgi:hypothetical protein
LTIYFTNAILKLRRVKKDMKPITILKKTNLNVRSSVYGDFEYGSNYAIADSDEVMVKRRGFHLTDSNIKNILHNLPEEFKPYARFIKDESEVEQFDKPAIDAKIKLAATLVNEAKKAADKEIANAQKLINIAKNTVKKAVAVVTPTKSETENKELEEGIEDTPLEDNPILNENYSDYDAAQTKDFGVRLKKYAKKTGIKVHPATKDIVKILAKINEGLK